MSTEGEDAMAGSITRAILALVLPALVFVGGASLMGRASGRDDALRASNPPNPKPLNMRLNGYTRDDVQTFWKALGPGGRIIEEKFLRWDLFFPVAYGGALAASTLWLLAMVGKRRLVLWALLPVTVTVLADWVENVMQLQQLGRYDSGVELQVEAIRLASAATIVKLLAGGVAFAVVLALTFKLIVIARATSAR
jgi:hypothetical protein